MKGKTKHNTIVFEVDEKVWRQNIQSAVKCGTLDAGFLGPYTSIAVQGKNADIEDDNGAIFSKINTDHLKL